MFVVFVLLLLIPMLVAVAAAIRAAVRDGVASATEPGRRRYSTSFTDLSLSCVHVPCTT
jgi:K+-transporting ATPase A subunit